MIFMILQFCDPGRSTTQRSLVEQGSVEPSCFSVPLQRIAVSVFQNRIRSNAIWFWAAESVPCTDVFQRSFRGQVLFLAHGAYDRIRLKNGSLTEDDEGGRETERLKGGGHIFSRAKLQCVQSR